MDKRSFTCRRKASVYVYLTCKALSVDLLPVTDFSFPLCDFISGSAQLSPYVRNTVPMVQSCSVLLPVTFINVCNQLQVNVYSNVRPNVNTLKRDAASMLLACSPYLSSCLATVVQVWQLCFFLF